MPKEIKVKVSMKNLDGLKALLIYATTVCKELEATLEKIEEIKLKIEIEKDTEN